MGCLFCGKEIGPLQQLKEEEFCCSAHRKEYASKLSRGIQLLSADERAPRRAAPFALLQRIQENRVCQSAVLRVIPSPPRQPVIRRRCPVAITPVLGALPWRVELGAVAHARELPAPFASQSFEFRVRRPRLALVTVEDPPQRTVAEIPPVSGRIRVAFPAAHPGQLEWAAPSLRFAAGGKPGATPVLEFAASTGSRTLPRPGYVRGRALESHAAAHDPGISVSLSPGAFAPAQVRLPGLAIEPEIERAEAQPAAQPAPAALRPTDRVVRVSTPFGPIRPGEHRIIRLGDLSQAAPRLAPPQAPAAPPLRVAVQAGNACPSGSNAAPVAFAAHIAEPRFDLSSEKRAGLTVDRPFEIFAFGPRTYPPDFSMAPPAKSTASLSIPALPKAELEPLKDPLENVVAPAADFIPLEYYSARVKGTWNSDPKPEQTRIALAYPPFRLSPLVADSIFRKTRSNLRFLRLPQSTGDKAKWMTLARVAAAGLLLGAVLVGGLSFVSSHMRSTPEIPAVADLGPANPRIELKTPQMPSQGMLEKVRGAIARRASTEIGDNFERGMQAWDSKGNTWAPGWSRHADGYVRTGELALFRPSMTYSSYHLEFMAQIEGKAMGWVIRARDKQNYHAMKLKVVDPGLRPVVAIVHYPVVRGKAGKRVETPLSVMIHNNEPVTVAVEVKGDRVITSVEGQEVDSWIESERDAGGVGFFSEAGEHARLYWMKVAVNRDLLGTVCGYVAKVLGDGGQSTASITPAGARWPSNWPLPQAPAQSPQVALSAALSFAGKRRNRPWVL